MLCMACITVFVLFFNVIQYITAKSDEETAHHSPRRIVFMWSLIYECLISLFMGWISDCSLPVPESQPTSQALLVPTKGDEQSFPPSPALGPEPALLEQTPLEVCGTLCCTLSSPTTSLFKHPSFCF